MTHRPFPKIERPRYLLRRRFVRAKFDKTIEDCAKLAHRQGLTLGACFWHAYGELGCSWSGLVAETDPDRAVELIRAHIDRFGGWIR